MEYTPTGSSTQKVNPHYTSGIGSQNLAIELWYTTRSRSSPARTTISRGSTCTITLKLAFFRNGRSTQAVPLSQTCANSRNSGTLQCSFFRTMELTCGTATTYLSRRKLFLTKSILRLDLENLRSIVISIITSPSRSRSRSPLRMLSMVSLMGERVASTSETLCGGDLRHMLTLLPICF